MSPPRNATANKSNVYSREIIYNPTPDINMKEIKDGTLLFIAYGCALVEHQTASGMYVYTAINLKTGKKEILSRRKLALNENYFDSMAFKINKSSIRGNSRFTIDKKPGENANSSTLIKTANYIFTEILPQYGYAIRDKQIKLAEHIFGVIRRRGISLAESEVGTGKTHAYLIAAVLAKRGRLNDFWLRGHYVNQSWAESAYMPVVVSTSSIALQEAIVTNYIPELSQILLQFGIINTPLTAVVRKGKEHYICEERLQRYYKDANPFTKKLLAPFLDKSASFDLTGADTLSQHIKRSICVRDKCEKNCMHNEECRYHQYLNKVNDPVIDFQITNHNYFLADKLHRVNGRKPLLPNYQLVIIDEAHKFLTAARSMYGLVLTDTELPELAQKVHTYTMDKSNNDINIHNLSEMMEEQSKNLFKRLEDNIPESDEEYDAERFPAVMDDEINYHLKSIAGIAVDIAEASTGNRVQTFYKERRDKTIWRLNLIGERVSALGEQNKLIYWLENRTEGEVQSQALCAVPKDLNKRLFRDLWSNGIPIILTSGTLSASGDFTRSKETLGLCHMSTLRLFETSMPSPFDYKHNVLLYISKNTPLPDNKDKLYIAAVAEEVGKLVRASHGHAAVLFTSYNVMGQVHSILKDSGLPFPLFRLERGGTHAIEQFKKSGNGVLLASGALWDGIDISGDALSMLIIVRLPFAVPDPISEYERTLFGSLKDYINSVIVPEMLVKLKQGFGRLIRTETDTGVVALLDFRIWDGRAYRSKFLRSLPNCKITSDVAEVTSFIQLKKPPTYFE